MAVQRRERPQPLSPSGLRMRGVSEICNRAPKQGWGSRVKHRVLHPHPRGCRMRAKAGVKKVGRATLRTINWVLKFGKMSVGARVSVLLLILLMFPPSLADNSATSTLSPLAFAPHPLTPSPPTPSGLRDLLSSSVLSAHASRDRVVSGKGLSGQGPRGLKLSPSALSSSALRHSPISHTPLSHTPLGSSSFLGDRRSVLSGLGAMRAEGLSGQRRAEGSGAERLRVDMVISAKRPEDKGPGGKEGRSAAQPLSRSAAQPLSPYAEGVGGEGRGAEGSRAEGVAGQKGGEGSAVQPPSTQQPKSEMVESLQIIPEKLSSSRQVAESVNTPPDGPAPEIMSMLNKSTMIGRSYRQSRARALKAERAKVRQAKAKKGGEWKSSSKTRTYAKTKEKERAKAKSKSDDGYYGYLSYGYQLGSDAVNGLASAVGSAWSGSNSSASGEVGGAQLQLRDSENASEGADTSSYFGSAFNYALLELGWRSEQNQTKPTDSDEPHGPSAQGGSSHAGAQTHSPELADATGNASSEDQNLFRFVDNLAFWQSDNWRSNATGEAKASGAQGTKGAADAPLPAGDPSQHGVDGTLDGRSDEQVQNLVEEFLGGMGPGESGSAVDPKADQDQAQNFALASSSAGSLASAVIASMKSLGYDPTKYEKKLEESRRTLQQSIGVPSQTSDTTSNAWENASKFDMSIAMMMAHYAFESYNYPVDGKWVTRHDGSRIAYLSPDFIREKYSGILSLDLKNLELVSQGDPEDELSAYALFRLKDSVEKSGAIRGTWLSSSSNDTVYMYTEDVQDEELLIDIMQQKNSFPFAPKDHLGKAKVPIESLTREGPLKLRIGLEEPRHEDDEEIDHELSAIEGSDTMGDRLKQEHEDRRANLESLTTVDGDMAEQEPEGPKFSNLRTNNPSEMDSVLVPYDGRALGGVYQEKKAGASARNSISSEHALLIVSSLSESDVARWLESVALGKYATRFTDAGVDGRGLLDLAALREAHARDFYKTVKEEFGVDRFGDVLAFAFELKVLISAAKRYSTQGGAERAGPALIQQIRSGNYSPASMSSALPGWSWNSGNKPEQAAITSDEGEEREQLLDWAMGRLSDLLNGDDTDPGANSNVSAAATGPIEAASLSPEEGEIEKAKSSQDTPSSTQPRRGLVNLRAQYFPFNESLSHSESPIKDVALLKITNESTGYRQKTLNNHDYMERWSRLSSKALKKATTFRGETLGETVCFVEANSTDTHVAIWRDKVHKRVVVSFRGTDINWKDFLTDLMCFQTDVSWLFNQKDGVKPDQQESGNSEPNFKVGAGGEGDTWSPVVDPSGIGQFVVNDQPVKEKPPKAHIGFCIAYASVREQVLEVIRQIVPEDEREEWTVYTTGHSLGAALATLLAVDVTLKLEGVKVAQYNFGSAKMGDEEFVKRYNKLVPNTFRMVNDADVIVRLPRNQGVGSIPGIGAYYHVGRTVLTSPECALWIEGESPGEDPLLERWEHLSDLLDAEVKLMRTVVDGKSFRDHVENGYYNAMLSLWDRSEPKEEPLKS